MKAIEAIRKSVVSVAPELRLPLVSDDRVVGVLAVDDLLIDLISDLGDVVRPITGEVIFGHHEASFVDVARQSS
jgi:hypothetical protein